MADSGFLVDNASHSLIQKAIDAASRSNPFGPSSESSTPFGNYSPLKGYLMQSVSRGEQALCHIFKKNTAFRCWKIDLAGVIYLNHPDGDSRFQLRFTLDADVFDSEIIEVEDLTIPRLCEIISRVGNGLFKQKDMLGALGHPTQHPFLVPNSDLYPELPSDHNFQKNDLIDSLIGSWIFGIPRSAFEGYTDVDIELLFTVDGSSSVQINGPAVMTIHEIHDCPTNDFKVVQDIMEVAQPTPLRGGTRVALLPFDDIGCYGIISANPREYLFRLDFDPE